MTQKALLAKKNLKDFRTKVDKKIAEIFDEELEIAEEFTSEAVDYVSEIKKIALADGKRLRPSFVYYTYIMHGGENFDEILKIAAAVEIVHVFFLIEDDFMDLASTRRGKETIHEIYRKYHEKNGFKKDSAHFGDAIAVNAGIIADHIAQNIFVKADFPAEMKLKAMNRLNRQIITTGHGQIHDILNEVKTDLTEQDIENVLRWKTGIYTYDNPIHIGALLAGATEKQLKELSEYAIPGGVAFQIQDDILGSFGNEEKTGKSASDDIKEGKQTLLTYKAYADGSDADREVLDRVLGDLEASEEDVEQVREIMLKTGSLEYSKQRSLELVKKAKASLQKNGRKRRWVDEGVDFLEGIADYMIDRDL